MAKALSRSRSVNAAIKALLKDKILPCELAKEALAMAYKSADVAIVLSANLAAIEEE